MMEELSVAMTHETSSSLANHLLRSDGQEDVCLALYAESTGSRRRTAIVTDIFFPGQGERAVHGNASFTGSYVLRACAEAAKVGAGVIILHSHPKGRGWQSMSREDAEAEESYSRLVRQLTGQPLMGMTLAGDGTWSARIWDGGEPFHGDSVRVVGTSLNVSWNSRRRPAPPNNKRQIRTVSAWGEKTQGDIARLRLLVIGVGSVGLDVAVRLSAAGARHVGVMDFDVVQEHNLDRMIGATKSDAERRTLKIEVARREMERAVTASSHEFQAYKQDITTHEGHATALNYDVIISCVDRPYPRAVLNQIAYSDLIPVIDGGIGIDVFSHGGMRGATIRTHTLIPGRPCMVCSGQIDLADVTLEKQGLLDDPSYIASAGLAEHGRQNVALLSIGVTAGLMSQLVSLLAKPGGRGVPAPLRHSLATHSLEHLDVVSRSSCAFEAEVGRGDSRVCLTRS
jgi:molybdopterin/thiamine biosynthesis adenylyltransferase